jgi:hypothetical protein
MASLIDRWTRAASRAVAWQPEGPAFAEEEGGSEGSGEPALEEVLEALALSVALELTGELGGRPQTDRDALRKRGQRALLHLGAPGLDEDEREALGRAGALARDGLRALAMRPPTEETAAVPGPLPAAWELVALLRGELDGFAAARVAMRVRRSPALRREVALLRAAARAEATPGGHEGAPLRLAAADTVPILDPSAGVSLGMWGPVEAILFSDEDGVRRLGLYAAEPVPLRLEASDVTPEGQREGYWVGRVEGGSGQVTGTLHVGNEPLDGSLDLPD